MYSLGNKSGQGGVASLINLVHELDAELVDLGKRSWLRSLLPARIQTNDHSTMMAPSLAL